MVRMYPRSGRGARRMGHHGGMSDAISLLTPPAAADLPEDARALQEAASEKFGFVPNVLRGWAVRPETLVRWRAHYDVIMLGESALTRVQREMIAVTVSTLNRCVYCSTTHPAFLRLALKDEGRDPTLAHALQSNPHHALHDARFTPLERALIAVAIRVTVSSHEMSAADLEPLRVAGLDDEAIFDALQTAAMFNFTNRLANATALQPNAEYHDMGR